jgi:peptidoglycan-associated lipoprotein
MLKQVQHDGVYEETDMKRTALALTVAALALSACAKKPPAVLPPAPVDSTGPMQPQGPTSGAVVPGSQEDFVASVAADRIFFALDESAVDEADRTTLQSQATWLSRYATKRVTIEGHCDERGTREYNLALGERRANATKNALVALGVSADRISTISYGKERPDATGSDEDAYAKNRRAVTVTIQ